MSEDELDRIINTVLENNSASVNDYKNGKSSYSETEFERFDVE